MKIIDLIKLVLPRPMPATAAERKQASAQEARWLVMRYARGSRCLREGRYLTAEEIEARKQALREDARDH